MRTSRHGVLIAALAIGIAGGIAPSSTTAQQPARTGSPIATSAGQLAPEGTAALSGTVTDANSGEPIAGVIVYLGFQGKGAVGRLSRQVSGEKGRFVFTDLPAGSLYFINAAKPGYLDGHYGVGAGGLLGGLITLRDGEWFANANVKMARPGSISGTVVDEHGEPVVNAFVRVLARLQIAGQTRLAAGTTAKTDDRGMYRIADVLPGRYLVQVPSVQQSVPASMTAADFSGLTAAQIASGRTVPDPPPALDFNAATRLVVGGYATPPSPVDGKPQAYPPVFYPGVPSVSAASTIEIKPGEDKAGIDLALRPSPATMVSGVVDGPADVLAGLVVRLLPEGLESFGEGSEVATAAVSGDGHFTLINVPAGSYTLDIHRTTSELQYRTPLGVASASLPSTPGVSSTNGGAGSIAAGPDGATYSYRGGATGSTAYYATMKIGVGAAGLSGLVVPLRHGVTIRGKFVTESGELPKAPAGPGPSTSLYAEPANGDIGLGILRATMPTPTTFQIEGLMGGEYLLRFLSLPGGASSILSVTVDGQDHRGKPFDGAAGADFDVVVTVGDKKLDLSGKAKDAKGNAVPNAIVIVFSVDRTFWTNYGFSPSFIRSAPTSNDSSYHFQSLAPGDYYVAGVPPDQADAWQDPAKLATLAASASRLTIAWGDTKVQDVVVVRLPS